jgi:ADP-ribosyl-[dinitrogen reductase] hydrolase
MNLPQALAAPAAPTGPLHVDWITLPAGGRIGMTHCPGRRGKDGSGRQWERDLAADLQALAHARVQALVTLIEEREFATLGVPGLPAQATSLFHWHHLPIPDMTPPGASVLAQWQRSGTGLLQTLHGGGCIVFHCAAGLGRTGTVVAKLLTDSFGLPPGEAIAQVRRARPGTIETAAQEDFVRGPPQFGPPVSKP